MWVSKAFWKVCAALFWACVFTLLYTLCVKMTRNCDYTLLYIIFKTFQVHSFIFDAWSCLQNLLHRWLCILPKSSIKEFKRYESWACMQYVQWVHLNFGRTACMRVAKNPSQPHLWKKTFDLNNFARSVSTTLSMNFKSFNLNSEFHSFST